jgi:hypothetical protein
LNPPGLVSFLWELSFESFESLESFTSLCWGVGELDLFKAEVAGGVKTGVGGAPFVSFLGALSFATSCLTSLEGEDVEKDLLGTEVVGTGEFDLFKAEGTGVVVVDDDEGVGFDLLSGLEVEFEVVDVGVDLFSAPWLEVTDATAGEGDGDREAEEAEEEDEFDLFNEDGGGFNSWILVRVSEPVEGRTGTGEVGTEGVDFAGGALTLWSGK